VDIIALVSHSSWTVDDIRFQQAYFTFKNKLVNSLPIHSVVSYFDYPQYVHTISLDGRKVRH
jgi:hypothetical protein